jgi:hypothetical protein
MLLPTAPKFQDLKFTCIKWVYTGPWNCILTDSNSNNNSNSNSNSGPGQRKEKTKRKEKGRETRMTKKRGKITRTGMQEFIQF